MFTQDFRPLKFQASVLGIFFGLYVCLHMGFLQIAQWAERHDAPYPYRYEDWLRYLLPPLFENKGPGRIFFAGPSTMRENILYEDIEQALPGFHAFQGGFSLGTINDVMMAFEYIQRVYGKSALPEICVIGFSARFTGNIPEYRPFNLGLEKYSPYFRVEESDGESVLIPKTPIEGFISWARFVTQKQVKRLRIGMLSAVGLVVGTKPYREALARYQLISQKKFPPGPGIKGFLVRSGIARLLGVEDFLLMGLKHQIPLEISPFKYHRLKPIAREPLIRHLKNPKSWWAKVQAWNPEQDSDLVRKKVSQFLSFARTNGIRVYAVNLPEASFSQALYAPGNTSRYTELLRSALADTPFLDLRDFSSDEEFFDAEHLDYEGAQRMTAEVIQFIRRYEGGVSTDMSKMSSGR